MSKIEDEVCVLIQSRATKGLEKYGVTLERDDLSLRQWLDHAIEESLDRVLYLYRARMKLIADESSERRGGGVESIPWAEYPQARWAMKDSEGLVRMANDSDRPVTIGKFWFARGGTYILGIGAHIPGPWTESLRKRPEGV